MPAGLILQKGQHLKFVSRVLLAVITGAGLLVLSYVFFLVYVFMSVDSDAYHAAEAKEYYRAAAIRWGIFCSEYDCDHIPLGYAVEAVGDEIYSLPLLRTPWEGEQCRLASSGTYYAEYVDNIVQRAADYRPEAMGFRVQCNLDGKIEYKWIGALRFGSGRFQLKEHSIHSNYYYYFNNAWKWEERPTFHSREELLKPVTEDFGVIEPDDNFKGRIYLSYDRIFQGRHVVLMCGSDCEVSSYSFQEDEALTSPHLYQRIKIDRPGYDCEMFEAQWSCGPWLDNLAAIAQLVKFMDAEVNEARKRGAGIGP